MYLEILAKRASYDDATKMRILLSAGTLGTFKHESTAYVSDPKLEKKKSDFLAEVAVSSPNNPTKIEAYHDCRKQMEKQMIHQIALTTIAATDSQMASYLQTYRTTGVMTLDNHLLEEGKLVTQLDGVDTKLAGLLVRIVTKGDVEDLDVLEKI